MYLMNLIEILSNSNWRCSCNSFLELGKRWMDFSYNHNGQSLTCNTTNHNHLQSHIMQSFGII